MDELKKKTPEERKALLLEKRESLRAFVLNLSGSKTRNTKEGRGIRKEIARILTLENNSTK